MSIVAERQGADGTRLFVAQDIDRSRWLWSARWPGHKSDKQCPDAPHPPRFRSGHAPTKVEAWGAAESAVTEGEPKP